MYIYHNSWKNEYREPFGAAEVGSVCHISLDVEYVSSLEVYLRTWKDGFGESVINMNSDGFISDNNLRYSVNLQLPDHGCLIWYYFIIKTSDNTYYYGNNTDKTGGEGMIYDEEPSPYQITVYEKSIAPQWFKDGICYQIFPDRFARDDAWKSRCSDAITARIARLNNGEQGSQTQFIESDWNKSAYYIKDDEGNVTDWPFYGGSLKGIESKLDYLRSLGVSVIYLNPIFEAVSNHRYDTADYMKIDPILGSEQDFIDLCKSAEERGISIVLDGVFSHTGADSKYFDKFGNYGGNGAYNNPDSKYRYWYTFTDEEACGYKAWWGVKDLPEVREDNAFYRQMIVGEDGVLKKWLKAGARGWRLDVADELPDNFIEYIRSSIKEESQDNVLIGEVWEDASNKISYDKQRKFLYGRELDSTMNYPLRQIIFDYINYTISSAQAANRIMSLMENYPSENFFAALNIVGSHDRERILTMMAGEEDYQSACRKLKIASALQYTLPGVPCIYYGDEIGMMGHNDPDNRNPYTWDNRNLDIAYHYRMLGLIYDEHKVLKDGHFELLSGNCSGINDDVLAFARYNADENIIVLVNRSYNSTRVDLRSLGFDSDIYALELLQSKEMKLDEEFDLERLSVKIILIPKNEPVKQKKSRRAGILCHISSIPGGTLGKPAREFVDWLASMNIKVWQILPINPTGIGDCPYNSYSAFAGNTDFINRDELPVDISSVDDFYSKNSYWLDDYINYLIDKLKLDTERIVNFQEKRKELILDQYYFDVQWKSLKKYANDRGIKIMGDLPIFVSSDSADVHGNREIFLLDSDGHLKVNAGVPPDDFSVDGQNWGLALYDWKALKESNYDWWIKRIRQCSERFDIIRLDHFRGFSEYYAIPDGKSAKEGNWQHGPGIDFFRKLQDIITSERLNIEILAEDLGILDAGVLNLLKLTGYPGMDIWQFSHDEMMNMPADIASTRAFYTGTHDNQTLIGWLKSIYNNDSDKDIKIRALDAIYNIFNSEAQLAILQIQDLFLFDDSARMNVPGIAEGNWQWKLDGSSISTALNEENIQMCDWLKNLIIKTNR